MANAERGERSGGPYDGPVGAENWELHSQGLRNALAPFRRELQIQLQYAGAAPKTASMVARTTVESIVRECELLREIAAASSRSTSEVKTESVPEGPKP
jgi:hypothetical protein